MGARLQLFTIPSWIYLEFNMAIALLAIWKGEWPGRAVGAAIMLKLVIEANTVVHWTPPAWSDLALDLLILGACLLGALRSGRYWTIWASSFALLSVVTHAMQFVPGIGMWAYLSARRVWAILLLATMLGGVISRARPLHRAAPGAA